MNVESADLCGRTWLRLLVLGAVLCARPACAGVALQYHCAGGSRLAGDVQLITLRKVLALPAATNFENAALARFAGLLTNSLPPGRNPLSASLIEPLLSDVVQSESLGSFDGGAGQAPGFILALRLEPPRAQMWQENLAKILAGHGEKFARQEFSGQRWHSGGAGDYWILPARDWLLLGCGDDFSNLQTEYLNQIKAQGRPVPPLEHTWLEADLDSARLGGWFRRLQPARIRLTLTPKEDSLHLEARALAAQAIPWTAQPWQIPRDLLRGQIISFTAGQNVAAFLKVNPALSQLPGSPLTNQFFFWALDQVPLLNFMAWPAPDASNTLASLAAEAPALLNPMLKRFNGTALLRQPRGDRLIWQNMRLFVPILDAARISDGQFLFLASFPVSTKAKPAPDGLLAQIQGHANLVYYDWEMTGRRLQEWEILGRMIANRARAPIAGAVDDSFLETQWFSGLAPAIGNTVTEITRVAPNELSVHRQGPVALTGVELLLLSDWICDVNSGPIHSAAAENMAPFPSHP